MSDSEKGVKTMTIEATATETTMDVHPKIGEMIAEAFELGGDIADRIFDALYEADGLECAGCGNVDAALGWVKHGRKPIGLYCEDCDSSVPSRERIIPIRSPGA